MAQTALASITGVLQPTYFKRSFTTRFDQHLFPDLRTAHPAPETRRAADVFPSKASPGVSLRNGLVGPDIRPKAEQPEMCRKVSGLAQADHHVDAADGHALGHLRQRRDLQLFRRGVGQGMAVFPVEMRMVVGAGVEVGL